MFRSILKPRSPNPKRSTHSIRCSPGRDSRLCWWETNSSRWCLSPAGDSAAAPNCVSVWRGAPLTEAPLSDIPSDMKTVTLRSFRRDAVLLDRAAGGEELLVTRFGKPYLRILPATQPRSFLVAGQHRRMKKAVSPAPVPKSEWKDFALAR